MAGCATPTPPPPPADRDVLVYPVLGRTTCSKPAPIAAHILSDDATFAAWLGSEKGRSFIKDERAGHWDCYDALAKIHGEEMAWPVGSVPNKQ